ncbi:unnamed protein product [Meloidogyne enterolobii]|uniref:Uncharacterized protein n=1 Tax=Meloidogyne enterolobii TaxID=390850 RepID=A0ACB0ZFE5_MELEN
MADKFYPPFPKKHVIGQYTFVEPDFKVKFPAFHCCQSHNAGCNSFDTNFDFDISTTTQNLHQNNNFHQNLNNNNKATINNPKNTYTTPSSTRTKINDNSSTFRTVNFVPPPRPLAQPQISIKPPIYTISSSPPPTAKIPSKAFITPSSPPSIPFKRPPIPPYIVSLSPPPIEAKSSFSVTSLAPSTSEISKLVEPKSEIEHEAMDQFVLSEQGNKSGFW